MLHLLHFWSKNLKDEFREFHRNQDYNNYVNAKDYKSAILLALAMDQPRRLLGLFTAVAQRAALDKQSITGSASVDLALTQLPLEQIYSLLLHIRDWNTSVRTSDVAQRVLHVVLKHFTLDELLQLGAGKRERPQDMAIEDRVFTDIKTGPFKRRKVSPLVGELLEGLIPYTDRHYARADRAYSQESFVLDYTLRFVFFVRLEVNNLMNFSCSVHTGKWTLCQRIWT